jgi:hypothetical protein
MARTVHLTALDLFRDLYRTGDADSDLSDIHIHSLNAIDSWRMRGAFAVTVGTDIYFRAGCYAPDSAAGIWLLAHEVAHVLQQRRGPVAALPAGTGWAVGPRDGAEELEADAAAFSVLAGKPFIFGPPSPDATRTGCVGKRIAQRFMGWEHLLLGNLDPAAFSLGAEDAFAQMGRQCALALELSKWYEQGDTDRLWDAYPEIRTLRLSGSGLVITLGELNILPDYLSHPADIDAAPASFMVPVMQAIRAQSYREITKLTGRRRPLGQRSGTLSYPFARVFPGIREALQIDAQGRKCGLSPSERYLSVLARNACHFAPFSWYRWKSFHLLARRMIAQSDAVSDAARQRLRSAARVNAGYADHFLQDSFAVGHLANKTLIMQWYIEWLLDAGASFADRALLAEMTHRRQPFLHGPDLYNPEHEGTVTDPQSVNEALSLDARVALSGVCGESPEQRLRGYVRYLTLLGSSVAQMPAGMVHDYLSKRPLVVADRPDGPRYQIRGDRTMLADGARPLQAAAAAYASRRAIEDLLEKGKTDITSGQLFHSMPRYVEADGELMSLPRWHEEKLRPLCFEKLFKMPGIRARKLLLGLMSPSFGVPSADYAELRTRHIVNTSL